MLLPPGVNPTAVNNCIISYHITSYIISYHVMSYHNISCNVIYHIISYHIISHHIIYHITSYHTISYYISHHIISYIIIFSPSGFRNCKPDCIDHLCTYTSGETSLTRRYKHRTRTTTRSFTHSGHSYKGRTALLLTSQHATDPGHNG